MKISLPSASNTKNPLFSILTVSEIMRRKVVSLALTDTISTSIRTLTKHKNDAVLITDKSGDPAGVVTKTELMGAYYAGMVLQTELSSIMGSPVISCNEMDSLESALVTMQQCLIHRIYVTNQSAQVIGTLSYPDIVGALYRFCWDCKFGHRKRMQKHDATKHRYSIKEVMTPSAVSARTEDDITHIIEQLSLSSAGALLINDSSDFPVGVISKTDLALAFCRNVPLVAKAMAVMRAPLRSCSSDSSLEDGIRQMIMGEISRIFIYEGETKNIIGILTLSDAARIRSGSCQACSSARIKVKDHDA